MLHNHSTVTKLINLSWYSTFVESVIHVPVLSVDPIMSHIEIFASSTESSLELGVILTVLSFQPPLIWNIYK